MKEWNKIDLHIHAEYGITFDGKTSDNNPNYYSLENMAFESIEKIYTIEFE